MNKRYLKGHKERIVPMIYTLLNESEIKTANWGGSAISTKRRQGEGLVHTTVDGTATVKIEGRMGTDSEWHTIDTTAQSNSTTATRVAIFPQMRAVVTSVNTGATATGGVSSTPATGSISISSNPSAAWDPTLIAILGTTATAATAEAEFKAEIADGNTLKFEGDGNRGTLNFEFDTSARPYTSTVLFNNTIFAGDSVSIYDLAGNGRGYNFVTAAGDNTDGTATEVLVGDGTTGAATNFTAAVNTDWVAGKIQIYASRSGTTVTLRQAALATNTTPPTETVLRSQSALTKTAWTGGTTAAPTLANAGYIPIAADPDGGTRTRLKELTSTYVAFTNEIAKGNLTAVNVTSDGVDKLLVTMKTPGTHHANGASLTVELPLKLVSSDAADVAIVHGDGGDGTNAILLEINEASETGGYTHIDRANDEKVETIIGRIATAVASTSWSGGTLTATSDYNNKSLTLQAAGASLTDFGNETIQIVNDPQNVLTVSGMSGGAAGVTVKCEIDVPESS